MKRETSGTDTGGPSAAAPLRVAHRGKSSRNWAICAACSDLRAMSPADGAAAAGREPCANFSSSSRYPASSGPWRRSPLGAREGCGNAGARPPRFRRAPRGCDSSTGAGADTSRRPRAAATASPKRCASSFGSACGCGAAPPQAPPRASRRQRASCCTSQARLPAVANAASGGGAALGPTSTRRARACCSTSSKYCESRCCATKAARASCTASCGEATTSAKLDARRHIFK
mmetsp:Transcript_72973/g.211249  ORF Transcript_72973/g.211249 Transcript_72973/m.211249 type:complete len:231 (+) Transcript_72973:232-924(+)